MNRKVTHYK